MSGAALVASTLPETSRGEELLTRRRTFCQNRTFDLLVARPFDEAAFMGAVSSGVSNLSVASTGLIALARTSCELPEVTAATLDSIRSLCASRTFSERTKPCLSWRRKRVRHNGTFCFGLWILGASKSLLISEIMNNQIFNTLTVLDIVSRLLLLLH